jgi:hypothetical protein
MVIAPALAPLALRGLGVGLLLATLCMMATTWVMNVTNVLPPEANLLDRPLLEERIRPGWYGLAAAFAAGVVGTVAPSKRSTDTLVGTVDALALVPAAAAAGIAFMSRDPVRGLGALLLLGMNVGLILAMGLLTLVIMLQFGSKPSDGEPSGNAEGKRHPRGERLGTPGMGLPTWALVLVALAIVALVVVLLAWFTAGPGKGLSAPTGC